MNANLDPQSDDRLSAYLDGELESGERAEFEELLAQRSDYQELLERLQQTQHEMAGLPRQELTSDLAAGVVARLHDIDPAVTAPPQDAVSKAPALVKRQPIAAPKAVFAVVGVLAASIAAMLIFSQGDGRDLAKAPPVAPTESVGSRVDQAEQQAAVRQLAEAKTSAELSADEARPARSIEPAVEESAFRGAVVAQESELVAANEMPSSQAIPQLDQFTDEPARPEPAASVEAAHIAAVPVRTDDETTDERMRRSSMSQMGIDVAPATIPTIVIQTQSDESYRQLVAVLSQAQLATSEDDNRALQEGYFEVREQLGRMAVTDELTSEKQLVQVIEVTTTPDQIEQLVATARDQRALVSNAGGDAATFPAAGKRGRAIVQEGQPSLSFFSGAVNRWQQMPLGSAGKLMETQANLGQPEKGAAGVQDTAMRDSARPTDADAAPRHILPNDQPTRWRITIVPAPK